MLVEMGESCKDCSKWAEDIYWAHFQTIRFSQTLLDDFDQELVSINVCPLAFYGFVISSLFGNPCIY